MSFGAPLMLFGLLAVPVLLAVYVLLQRRRAQYAVRFTNLDLLAAVAAERPGWRRHAPVAAYLLALVALVGALARPEAELEVARERSTVVLTTDVSASMQATDVEPTRLAAAKQAAHRFLDLLPDRTQVGLVTFSDTAQTLTRPTDELDGVRDAIEALQPVRGTAMGEGIRRALDDLESSGALSPDGELPEEGQVASARPPLTPASSMFAQDTFPPPDPLPSPDPSPPPDPLPSPDEQPPGGPPPEGADTPPASILLLSDGENTIGSDPIEAAERARELGVPIFTVSLGTDEGRVTVPDELGIPTVVDVPPDRETLRRIAEMTGGAFFDAPTDEELEDVYERLSTRVATTTEQREVTAAFAGAGLALILIGGLLSLAWFHRFP